MTTAIDVLTNHQKQLDCDGTEVGVSRQALDEVLTSHRNQTAILGKQAARIKELADDNEAEKYIKERRDILDSQDWGNDKKIEARLFELGRLIDGLRPAREWTHEELDYKRIINEIAEGIKKSGHSHHPLKQEIDRLTETLEVYADKGNWTNNRWNGSFNDEPYHIAREAIVRHEIEVKS